MREILQKLAGAYKLKKQEASKCVHIYGEKK